MQEKDLNKKEKRTLMIVSLVLVLTLVLGISFAYFLAQGQSTEQTITTASLGLEFDDGTPIMNASNISPLVREAALPKQDSTGKVTTAGKAATKEFTIKNTGDKKMFINISLDDITLGAPDPENSNIPKLQRFDFLWSLYEVTDKTNNIEKNVSNGSFEYVNGSVDIGKYLVFEAPVTEGDVTTYDEKTYKLYIWIEETNLDQSYMMGQEFSATIKAVGEEYWTSPESEFFLTPSGEVNQYNGTSGNISIVPSFYDTTMTTIAGDNNMPIAQNIESIIIPNTINNIGISAFDGNKLTELVIPNSVTSIAESAFANNDITNVTIPNSITSIKSGVFSSNELTSVVIPNSVTSIGNGAFEYNDLTNVIIPNSVTSIGNSAFEDNDLTNVIIPNSVTSIGSGAFALNQLTTVVIPASVTTVGGGAFAGNPNLTKIIIQGKTSLDQFTNGGDGFMGNESIIEFK